MRTALTAATLLAMVGLAAFGAPEALAQPGGDVPERVERGVESTEQHLQYETGDPVATEAPAEGEHWSIFLSILPPAAFENLSHMMGPSWLEKNPHVHVSHIFMALVVFVLMLLLALAASKRLQREEDYLVPAKKWGAFAFFDVAVGVLLGMMERMMPRDKALAALPLVTAFAIFILFSNLLGLVPGFLPPTDSLNTTLALGLTAFVAYNYWGIKTHGFGAYFKHFLGPMPALAPLMLPIELISHFARPLSLALRLMGNMFGDHMVLGIFLGFNLLFVPLPVMVLGVLVCVVQTLVFTLLTIVYISMAVEVHEHHDHEDHALHHKELHTPGDVHPPVQHTA